MICPIHKVPLKGCPCSQILKKTGDWKPQGLSGILGPPGNYDGFWPTLYDNKFIHGPDQTVMGIVDSGKNDWAKPNLNSSVTFQYGFSDFPKMVEEWMTKAEKDFFREFVDAVRVRRKSRWEREEASWRN